MIRVRALEDQYRQTDGVDCRIGFDLRDEEPLGRQALQGWVTLNHARNALIVHQLRRNVGQVMQDRVGITDRLSTGLFGSFCNEFLEELIKQRTVRLDMIVNVLVRRTGTEPPALQLVTQVLLEQTDRE